MTWSKAFICGCAGTNLNPQERAFLREQRPWGLILFRRNIDQPSQIKELLEDFRNCVGRSDAAVLIDQEGGRVQRLGPPHWPKYPPAAAYGRASGGRLDRVEAARLGARLIAQDLATLGITVDCLPVLDVPASDGHQIIGDRAYSSDPDEVGALGRAAVEGLMAGGVAPVVKHIPGHGRARADSHLELPVVHASRAELARRDFAPFKALADAPAAMTAHVVYAALDAERPATLSRTVLQDVVRGEIGFKGLLMTDDLSMKALSGAFEDRARAAFEAGADLALHCNGDLGEASAIAEASPILQGPAHERAEAALSMASAKARSAPRFDPVDARERLKSLLASGV